MDAADADDDGDDVVDNDDHYFSCTLTSTEHIGTIFFLLHKQLIPILDNFSLCNPVFFIGHSRHGRIERCTGCSRVIGKRVPLLIRKGTGSYWS